MLVLSGLTCQAHNPMSINNSKEIELYSTTDFVTRVASPMPDDQALSTLAHAISKVAKDRGLTVLYGDNARIAEITLSQQKQLQNKLHKPLIRPIKTTDWRGHI